MVKIRSTGNPYEADRPKPRHRANFNEVVDSLAELLKLDNSEKLAQYLRSLICDALKNTKFQSENDCVYNCEIIGQMGLNAELTIVDPNSSPDKSEEHFSLHFTGGQIRALPNDLKGQISISDLSKVQMVTRKSLILTVVKGVSQEKKKSFQPLIGREFKMEIPD